MRLFSPASPTPTPTQLALALTILRVVTGVVFLAHGAQKLFVWGFDGVGAGFAQMGIPLAGIVGPAVALVEFFGGMALVAGLLTRLAGIGLAIVMTGAIFIAHLAGGFFLPSGFEFVFTLLGSAVTLALTGAGPWSIDARLVGPRPDAPAEVRSVRRAA